MIAALQLKDDICESIQPEDIWVCAGCKKEVGDCFFLAAISDGAWVCECGEEKIAAPGEGDETAEEVANINADGTRDTTVRFVPPPLSDFVLPSPVKKIPSLVEARWSDQLSDLAAQNSDVYFQRFLQCRIEEGWIVQQARTEVQVTGMPTSREVVALYLDHLQTELAKEVKRFAFVVEDISHSASDHVRRGLIRQSLA
jgi:hypothetical protein